MPKLLSDSTYNLPGLNDREIVTRLEQMFLSSVYSPIWKSWRTNAEQDFQFYEGDQWTALERAILEERGQPIVKENLLKPKIERLLGQFQRQHSTIKFLGRNAPVDEPLADGMSDMLRWVDQTNGAEFEEGDQVKDGFIGGFGVMEYSATLDEAGRMIPRLRAENPFYIFPDPHTRRYDWNEDAKFIARSKWMDLDDAIALWPEKARELRQCINYTGRGTSSAPIDPAFLRNDEWYYADAERGRLRPVELWYKRKVVKRAVITSTGVNVELDYLGPRQALNAHRATPGSTLAQKVSDEMWVGIYCGGLLIHHDRSPYSHGMFPFIPYFADRKKDGEPYGWVRNLVSIQQEINKRRSKALHQLSNEKLIYERSAVRDPGELASEAARADGHLVLEDGKKDKFEIVKNLDLAQGQMVMHSEAKATFDTASGQGPEAMGQASEVRSGVGIARKQMATDLITLPLFQSIRRTRRIAAKMKWGLIKQYCDEDMVFQVTDDPNAARVVTVKADELETMKQLVFDMVVADTEDSLTVQSEQFEIVSSILPQILQYGPQWAKILLSMSQIRNKEGFIKMIEETSQPHPPDPKISVALTWSDMTPQEKAAFAQRFGMDDLAQIELQQGEPSSKQVKAQLEASNQASKERMNQTRVEAHMVEHGHKTQAELFRAAMDSRDKRVIASEKAKADVEKAKAKPKAKAK